jgi:hypothetical protein
MGRNGNACSLYIYQYVYMCVDADTHVAYIRSTEATESAVLYSLVCRAARIKKDKERLILLS